MNTRPVIFLCDATPDIGLGHVSRCLALAEAFQEQGRRSLFQGRLEAGALDMIGQAGFAHRSMDAAWGDCDREALLEAATTAQPCAVIIDSYAATSHDLSLLQSLDVPVAAIDDFARLSRYDCSAVLNFTVAAPQLPYRGSAKRWLLGPEHLLVRRALRSARQKCAPARGPLRRVLVCVGGCDRHNLTLRLVRQLRDLDCPCPLHVVVGASYAETETLKRALTPRDTLEVQIPDLASALSAADLCICGGGLTKYEAAYLGVPCAVLSQDRDQAMETVQFAEQGLAMDLGLGTAVRDEELSQRLDAALRDEVGQRRLREAGLHAFPSDPTANAATALTTLL